MSVSDLLLAEFDEEMKKTRTTLERIPHDRLEFAPFLKCGILCHNVSRTVVGNDWRAGSHHALFR